MGVENIKTEQVTVENTLKTAEQVKSLVSKEDFSRYNEAGGKLLEKWAQNNIKTPEDKTAFQSLLLTCKIKTISPAFISLYEIPEKESLSETASAIKTFLTDSLQKKEAYDKIIQERLLEEEKKKGEQIDQRIEQKDKTNEAKRQVEEQKDKAHKEEIEQLKESFKQIGNIEIAGNPEADLLNRVFEKMPNGELKKQDIIEKLAKLTGETKENAVANFNKILYLKSVPGDTKIKENGKDITVAEWKSSFLEKTKSQSLDDYVSDLMAASGVDYNDSRWPKQNEIDDRERVSKNFLETTYNPKYNSPDTGKTWNRNGFDNSFSRFRDAFSTNTSMGDYLGKQLDDVVNRTMLIENESGSAFQQREAYKEILPPGDNDFYSALRERKNDPREIAKLMQTYNFTASSQRRERAIVMRNLMEKDKIKSIIGDLFPKENIDAIRKYIWGVYGSNNPRIPVNPMMEGKIARILTSSFLSYSRRIMKTKVAQAYFSQISEVLEAGGQKVVMDNDENAIKFTSDGGMEINYHTLNGNVKGATSKVQVSPSGVVSITDIYAGKTEAGAKDMTKTNGLRRLAGSVVPISELVQKIKQNKNILTEQWNKNIIKSGTNYENGAFSKAIRGEINNILGLSDTEKLRRNMMKNSMRHMLQGERVFDSLADLYQSVYIAGGGNKDGKQDAFIQYHKGEKSSIDQTNNADLESIFAIRDTCKSASAQEVAQFEKNIVALKNAYQGRPKEQNIFLQDTERGSFWEFFTQFKNTTTGNGKIDLIKFNFIVGEIVKEKPANLQERLLKKDNKYIEAQLPENTYTRQLTKQGADNFLSKNLSAFYNGPRSLNTPQTAIG